MAASAPLTGSELIDCAKANSNQGIEAAASRCGYNDIPSFEQALRKAGDHIGVTIHSFEDLSDTPSDRPDLGMEIAPESPSEF